MDPLNLTEDDYKVLTKDAMHSIVQENERLKAQAALWRNGAPLIAEYECQREEIKTLKEIMLQSAEAAGETTDDAVRELSAALNRCTNLTSRLAIYEQAAKSAKSAVKRWRVTAMINGAAFFGISLICAVLMLRSCV